MYTSKMDTFEYAFTIVNKVNEGVHDDNMDKDFDEMFT